MKDYSKTSPEEIWKLIRSGEIDYPTAGMCAGYAQANLVILPKKYAEDFKEFARKNPNHVRSWKWWKELRMFMIWEKALIS